MNKLQIVVPLPKSPISCWSLDHRCFLGKLEHTLIIAAQALGGRPRAELWLLKPAIGLDNKVPYSMISTKVGYERVITFLKQVKHGIYV